MSRLFVAASARRRPPARRGAIVIVVLGLLTIFAVVGISAYYYSDGEALAARYHRESQSANGQMRPTPPGFDSDAETVIGKLIFGDYSSQLNSFRGHDLLTAMYGGNGTNTDPYTGQGIAHEALAAPFDTALTTRGHVVSYTPMQVGKDAKGNPAFYAFDPEVTGPPRDFADPLQRTPTDRNNPGTGRKYVSKAAPYTYPDLNNFYLAALAPGTGETILPSFYRPWHFNSANPDISSRLAPWNPGDTGRTALNTDWVTAEGRARTLRPRPVDQLNGGDLGSLGLTRVPTASELPPVATALYNLIDARIRSGDIIGYPRPNQDGGTTGDVFNVIGGVGVQHNDSILVDFGGTPFEWPRGSGKYIKPLAAVHITDLDGLLNLNAHGNVRNGGNHASFHGLGPWEVNLSSAFGGNVAEGNAVVASRLGKSGSPAARNGATTYAYAPSAARFAAYGLVNWDATGTGGVLQIPSFGTANQFNTTANYAGAAFYADNDVNNAADPKPKNHPALFNPGDWAAFPEGKSLSPLPPGGHTYPINDTRRLRQRYAGELDLYQQSTLARIAGAPTKAIIGDGATYAPGTANYRNDPAHGRRLLFTTLSADHDRPKMMGNGTNGTGNLTLATGAGILPTNAGLTGTLNAGATATVMPAFDINRPLADYRDLTSTVNTIPDPTDPMMIRTLPNPQPLSSSNMGNVTNAALDRQNYAREVFARFVIATGGNASVATDTGAVTINATTGTADYDALRYLAQLAANVTDYIDTDDVSTAFVWNPQNATDPLNAVNFGAGELENRVVFGVEAPRLVLNETYAEVVNDQNGKGKGKAKGNGSPNKEGHVRFWVELVNPSATPYATGTGPLGDGSAMVKDIANPAVVPYKIAIARNVKGGTDAMASLGTPSNVTGAFPAGHADLEYDFRHAGTSKSGVNTAVVLPNNGKYNPAGNPTLGLVLVGPEAAGATPGDEFDPTAGGMPGAPWDNMIQSPALNPPAGGTPNAMEYLITTGELNSLDLTQANSAFRRHVVLLRRLANPYQQESATNPYVTVDVMDYVPSNDGVYTGNGSMMAGGVPLNQRFSVGRVQPMAGQAMPTAGMGLPTYAFPTSFLLAQTAGGAGNEPKHTLGRHNGATVAGPAAATYNAGPPGTLSGETIMSPFDWFVHLDRPLINEMELLHVQGLKPHQVTQYTFQPGQNPTTEPVRKNLGLAPWFGVTSAAGANQGYPTYDVSNGLPAFQTSAASPGQNATANGLYRALEMLRGKSRVYGTATGGRVQGKVNINTAYDARILIALLDPQAGNVFGAAEVYNPANPADPTTIWGRYIGSRTRGLPLRTLADGTTTVGIATPGKTVDDDPFDPNWATLDRPFKSFGVAESGLTKNYGVPPLKSPSEIIVGGGNSVAVDSTMTPAPFGPGLQDTMLRVNPVTRLPLAFTNGPAANHPYLQAEALRKLAGNTTTVSNVFAMNVTIVYHSIRRDPATGAHQSEVFPGLTAPLGWPPAVPYGRPRLGSEAFLEVPGDMRRQYLTIVDRSNAMVGSATSSTAMTNPAFQAATGSEFTLTKGTMSSTGTFNLANATVNTTNSTVTVATDGQVFTLSASGATGTVKTIFIGSGADRLSVDITNINTTTNPGAITVTDSSNTARTFPAGAMVSNGMPGRVDAPTTFRPIQERSTFPYGQLVPFCDRVR